MMAGKCLLLEVEAAVSVFVTVGSLYFFSDSLLAN